MRAALPILLVSLSACATTTTDNPGLPGPVAEMPTARDGLGPQTLAPGECGLFGWNRNQEFVFFATPTRALVEVFASNQGRTEIIRLEPSGEFPALAFDRRVELKLGAPEDMVEGRRYRQALMTQTVPSSQGPVERLVPLTVIESCQA